MQNSTKSDFQIANPLHPLKFWKKIIEKIVLLGILSVLLSLALLIPALLNGNSSDIFSLILWVIIIYLVSMAIYATYVKYYIKYYFYDGGADFITIKKGVFAPTEIHVQYQKIQDVYVDQDILDRAMGLYDVHIASATVSSGIEAHIDGVDKETAERLKDFFLQKIKEKVSGYQTTSNQSAGISTGQSPSTLNLNEVVSTDTYPISGRWIFAQIITSFFLSIFSVFIVAIPFFSPGENGGAALSSYIGLGWSDIMWVAPLMVIIFVTLQTIYTLFWINTFSFRFLPEYIFLRTGVIARQEKHVPYNTIQDVSVGQGIVERILGIATVKIENAAGAQFVPTGRRGALAFNGVALPGQPIDRAQRITQILKEGVLSRTTQQGTGL